MKKITGRDIRFFMLGVLAMFTFLLIYDWEDFEKGFKRGVEDASHNREYNYEKLEYNPKKNEQTTASEQEVKKVTDH